MISGKALGSRDYALGDTAHFVMLCFVVGAVAGSLVGSASITADMPTILSGFLIQENSGALGALWNCGKFHLFALVSATSLLGVFAIPLLVGIRGYLISCTAAAIYLCYPDNGILISLVVIGLPALLTLPCLIVIAADSLATSRRLLAQSAGLSRTEFQPPLIRHSLVSLIFLAIAAMMEEFLLPVLLAAIM